MFHSIRWRMVASYTLLTLLTVSLLGLLVLSLMQRYMERQEQAFLNANAEAVARQSGLFMQPAMRPPALYQLAQTAALFGDVHVKILDEQKRIVADSGQPTTFDKLFWVVSGEKITALGNERPPIFIFNTSATAGQMLPVTQIPDLAERSIMIRKSPTIWGARLDFEAGALITQTLQSPVAVITKEHLPLPPLLAIELPRSPTTVTTPIRTGETVLGYVEISSGPNFALEALAAMRQVFLMAGLGVALIAVILGLVVSQGLTAPLQGLAAATSRMNNGDLSACAPVHRQDEIGILAHQFNQMAAALENSFTALAAERDALRRFIADASHELRTPITALHTFNELLQGDAAKDLDAQREFLQESQEQVNRLARITTGLLNLSRLDSGLVELALTEHDLGEVVAAVAMPFKRMAEERNINFMVESATEPIQVRCDRNQIEMALTNLLDNALKFTPTGGQIRMGTARSATEVKIWVKDNGPGIDPEALPRIFERFYRGCHASAAGSGLGLAIVQSIMQAHGGQVEVASVLASGSCFTLKLPLT